FSDRVRYCGDFYGQGKSHEPYPEGISLLGVMRILQQLSLGFTELGCHPGEGEDIDSMYRTERAKEVDVLCDPRIGDILRSQRIILLSFHDVPLTRRTQKCAEERT